MPAVYIKGLLSEILELGKLKRPLIEILKDVMSLWPVDTIEISSAFRENDTGVHGVWRGLDIRTIILPKGHEQVYPIAEQINNKWIYDPSRPHKVVAYAALHGTGYHLHLQVHDRTIQRNNIPKPVNGTIHV